MGDLLSLTEAAARLAVDEGRAVERSTLSRYVSRYADALAPERRGKETVVDYDRLRQHRRDNVNLVRDSGPPAALPSARRLDTKAEREKVALQRDQITLAEKLGQVVPIDEVDREVDEAVLIYRAEADRRLDEAVRQLERITGTRAAIIRPTVRQMLRAIEDGFWSALTTRIDQLKVAPAAAALPSAAAARRDDAASAHATPAE